MGFGGAIFVQEGATITIRNAGQDTQVAGGAVANGAGGSVDAGAGMAAGQGLFLQGSGTLTLE